MEGQLRLTTAEKADHSTHFRPLWGCNWHIVPTYFAVLELHYNRGYICPRIASWKSIGISRSTSRREHYIADIEIPAVAYCNFLLLHSSFQLFRYGSITWHFLPFRCCDSTLFVTSLMVVGALSHVYIMNISFCWNRKTPCWLGTEMVAWLLTIAIRLLTLLLICRRY